MNNNYYVYALLDPRKNGPFKFDNVVFDYEPFYIGKGKGNRINYHFSKNGISSDKNKHKINKILKIIKLGFKPIKLKIYENIDEEKSLELEKNLIKLIGKKNLTNMTDGGEKCVHWDDLDSNTKIKLRKQRSDKMIGDKNPMKNKETSIKISNSLKGIIRTDEYKKEMSEKIKNSKKHKNGTGSLKNREIHRKYQEKNMKPVIQYDKNMNYINEFPSICETARQTGMKKGDIYSVVHCKQKSTHGFIFIFKNKISEK